MYADLHCHLYGCLDAKTLYQIGKNNPIPRWHLFVNVYEKIFQERISIETFFEDYKKEDKFKELYYFKQKAPFSHFQAKFNLILALISLKYEDIQEVASLVSYNHSKQNISYAEYRVLFPPGLPMEEKKQRILVLCKGFQEGEDKSNGKIRARLAMSLQRESGYEEDYNLLKYLQKENPLIQKYLVAIDFCHVEEGYPPSDKKDFFRIVLDDNKKNPASALAILYHVAESFTDKTPSSAVRWVIEAAEYGAHRLGHCLALGLEAQSFHNITFQESVKERLAQLEFLLSRHEDIAKFGYIPTEENLEKEIQELQKHKPEEKLSLYFNEERVSELHSIQEYGMRVLKDRKTVIESCPTSNLFIGMIDNVEKLPLKRFLENSLSVSIGTDDPGIFDTNIENEFTYLKQIGFSEKHQELRKCSFAYRSEVLSGRI